MRKTIMYTLFFSLLLSCSNDDDNFVSVMSYEIRVNYDETYGGEGAAGAKVTFLNLEDGRSYASTTGDSGLATVDIVPGNYNLTASLTMSKEDFETFTGQEVEGDVQFNASLQNIAITAEQNESAVLRLVTGTIGNLLLKQIYYAGSDTKLGAIYRDQFFEIHNNSNDTLYLDGLCFAQLFGSASTPSSLQSYHLPNGQLDWSKSVGQSKGDKSNTDYVYADEVIRIPGTGNEYPLAPGKSAIVAGTAVNHKAPLTIVDDEGEEKVYQVENPDLTVDLSGAPFEVYFRDYLVENGGSFLDSDIDNPNSVNVEVAFKSYSGKDLILDANGRDAFALFYGDDEIISSWDRLTGPDKPIDDIEDKTTRYLQVPVSVLIDAVEVQQSDPARQKPKRLPDVADAGEISVPKGRYSSQSVIRKQARIIGDRVIYQDTNNSSEDFEVLDHPLVEID
ncbi:DUF4876 domain-containing protein [Sinomicrobium oceani]|uniref:DUF4876 domain-containing protein n=1 Tax=Sinomicrobium oceani TaxID=1150368 RepID=UPI00227C1F52|nr:DUF4876 domain-containing protein [Sinomicrobium oceani]